MRKEIMAVAVAGALMCGWTVAVAAQDNGIVIQNNGVDSSQSSAGADNVNISRASGNSSSNNGAGANNEAGRVVKEKNRDRKDRNNTEEVAAPVDAPAAPAEGDYQAYTEEGEWVEPVPELAPQDSGSEVAQDANAPIQLPNTGAGNHLPIPMYVILAGIALAIGGAQAGRRIIAT